ncbi:GMC family oxidoreductase [Aeromicrobium phragmitis]|uniref:GMC family oxidoreductase n=1 Tax=Aeromicrobium phragmitis TaxID=2478914 RepID=A0A3L8PPJ6_9ACTN|nr:GMC family oxidoreductase [Aeromicrobium phragmitis]RLV57104.1 GMC family oxidoreductase [Aeromicrobium phragmitis]
MANIIVVGAGSAGCVVAARLSESGDHQVTLLESGPDEFDAMTAGQLASLNWLEALKATGAFASRLMATRLGTDAPREYQRGRGVGGSGLVNAMLALPGLPSDYDGWATDYGLGEWSWSEVEPWFARLKKDVTASGPEQYTPIDQATVAAATSFGLPSDVDTYGPDDGGGALWRHADERGRRSSREAYLDPARSRANLVVRPNSEVLRLVMEGDRATGVELADGTLLEADEVVLCAGAIESPAVLLRTGVNHRGIGKRLQDHPAASVYLRLKPEYRAAEASGPCIGSVLRLSSSNGEGDLHFLPLHGPLAPTEPETHGVLMAAVMRVTSRGEVSLNPDDPNGPPVTAENMLSTPEDRRAMREAVRLLQRLVATEPFQEIVESVFIDTEGTPLSALDDEPTYEAWLDSSVGDYFHAVGTVRMGRSDDDDAVVDQRGRVLGVRHLRVIDASIMPDVPRANTHLPTVMVAERLSAAMLDDLAEATTHEGVHHVAAQ